MESSFDAFNAHLQRGYGIELDPRPAKNGLVVIHDGDLKRASGGADLRRVSELTLTEFVTMNFNGSHLGSFRQVLESIKLHQVDDATSAIHLKHSSQDQTTLDMILADLAVSGLDPDKFIMFDVAIATARYLKEKNPALQLAPSVAHPYDIARYNSVVGGTLLSLEEVLIHRDLFDWVWLDEWDLADRDGGKKKFYTPEIFKTFHDTGLNVALVTPELHGTSPGLLGGEAHEDARDHKMLMMRIKEILSYGPDAVCTDYPDEVKALIIA